MSGMMLDAKVKQQSMPLSTKNTLNKLEVEL